MHLQALTELKQARKKTVNLSRELCHREGTSILQIAVAHHSHLFPGSVAIYLQTKL